MAGRRAEADEAATIGRRVDGVRWTETGHIPDAAAFLAIVLLNRPCGRT